MSFGCNRKLLRVNLTKGTFGIEEPDEVFYRRYFGGRGLIAYFLLRELGKGIDPLSAKNKLIFACGPVTGSPISGAGRHSVGAKSPLTGGYGEAEAGGFWGTELKKAGFDALIIEGVAREPSYLWIRDDQVEIRNAGHLWGKQILETEEIIKKELLGKNWLYLVPCRVVSQVTNTTLFFIIDNIHRCAKDRNGQKFQLI